MNTVSERNNISERNTFFRNYSSYTDKDSYSSVRDKFKRFKLLKLETTNSLETKLKSTEKENKAKYEIFYLLFLLIERKNVFEKFKKKIVFPKKTKSKWTSKRNTLDQPSKLRAKGSQKPKARASKLKSKDTSIE